MVSKARNLNHFLNYTPAVPDLKGHPEEQLIVASGCIVTRSLGSAQSESVTI